MKKLPPTMATFALVKIKNKENADSVLVHSDRGNRKGQQMLLKSICWVVVCRKSREAALQIVTDSPEPV